MQVVSLFRTFSADRVLSENRIVGATYTQSRELRAGRIRQ